MNVLSLCDGMSCGQIALRELGIPIENYFAAEIKPSAIKVTQKNYPSTIQIGDVNKISYKDGILYTEKGNFKVDIDFVMFGSPCQTFSQICIPEKRIGLEDKKKSGLFFECNRIKEEVNPKYWFIENVASMKNVDRDTLSNILGCKPYKVDAKDIGPVNRNRYYWTNLPLPMITSKKITFNDILDNGYFPSDKGGTLMASQSRPNTTPIRLFFRGTVRQMINIIFLSKEHYEECYNYFLEKYCKDKSIKKVKAVDLDIQDENNIIFEGIRPLNKREYERCHEIPEGYTDCLTWRETADVIGDGWHIGIIKEFFKYFIEREKK